MKIAQKYSHINGEEYLLVHHQKEYKQIKDVIESIDVHKHKTKISEGKGRDVQLLYNPSTLKTEFKKRLNTLNWNKGRRDFHVSTNFAIVNTIDSFSYKKQRKYLESREHPLHNSYNQIDFIKNKIGVEVQLSKYFAVTYDLFVKHLSFYSNMIINIGIEIVPTKKMQLEMSSGSPWFEKEVHNVMRHGRTNPPVPLLILGIEP